MAADRRPWLAALVVAALAVSLFAVADSRVRAALAGPSAPDTTPETVEPAPALRVQGNRLLDPTGRPVQLRGVNRMGLEFSCVQGKGLGQPFDQRSIDALKSWGVNVVRLPLNEHCWLGIGGEPSGEAYREGVAQHVDLLVSNDLFVILDLHWSAPRARSATASDPMPNADHSALFWSSVAERFKHQDQVLLDLFNEPAPNNNEKDDADGAAERSWRCWRDGAAGGTCDATQLRGMAGSEVVGMQSLVDAVRATGATNVIMLGGIQFANTLWSNPRHNWLAYKPVDRLNRIVASLHIYNKTWCRTVACLQTEVAPVEAQVPLVTAEIGNDACDATWLTTFLKWFDQRRAGYLAWTWNVGSVGDCGSMKLIVDEAGTPSSYGQIFKTYLASR
ncbi:MAG TPA: cellulase family glycosylhydrolase [Candidatus Limnocylindria bacterium]|nr:cellulase family glycosylhydrolase [Candidatus Limnocylindria bacterium]